jgi:hypothetical protein
MNDWKIELVLRKFDDTQNGKLTKIFCIKTSFKVWFMEDFGLFRVQFRQISLYYRLA